MSSRQSPQVIPGKQNQQNPNQKKETIHETGAKKDSNQSEKLLANKYVAYSISIILTLTFLDSLVQTIASNVVCKLSNSNECAWFIHGEYIRNKSLYSYFSLNIALMGFLAIIKIIPKLYGWASFIFYILFVFLYDNEITTFHYGGLLTKLIGLLSLLSFIGLWILYLFYVCFKQNQIPTLIVSTILVGTILFVLNKPCGEWKQGLNGQTLIQSNDYCHVQQPWFCPYSLFESILNFTPILVGECTDQHSDKDLYFQFMPKLDNSKDFIGFGLTTPFSQHQRTNNTEFGFHKTFLNAAQSYNTLEQALSDGREMALNLQDMEYQMQVERNQILVQERIQNQQFNPFSKKVISIFMDAVSRQAFLRSLPKTAAWILNREKKSGSATFQFFRTYSVKPYTYPNFLRFYFEMGARNVQTVDYDFSEYFIFPCQKDQGEVKMIPVEKRNITRDRKTSNFIDFSQYPESCLESKILDDPRVYHWPDPPENVFRLKQVNLLDTATKAGFVVGRSTDECLPTFADIFDTDMEFFYDQPPDHEGIGFACDPNYFDPEDKKSFFRGPYAVTQRCLNGQSLNDHVLEYARHFLQAYKEDNSFLMLEFIVNHEPSGSVLQYLDEPLSRFFIEMEDKGLLDDTLVVFFSDHGQHGHIFMSLFESQQFFTERMMPNLIISTPRNFNEQYPEKVLQLENNSQKLFTLANLHFFLQSWFKGGNYWLYQQSLLSSEYPSNHDCYDSISDYDQMYREIGAQICVCENPKK